MKAEQSSGHSNVSGFVAFQGITAGITCRNEPKSLRLAREIKKMIKIFPRWENYNIFEHEKVKVSFESAFSAFNVQAFSTRILFCRLFREITK